MIIHNFLAFSFFVCYLHIDLILVEILMSLAWKHVGLIFINDGEISD